MVSGKRGVGLVVAAVLFAGAGLCSHHSLAKGALAIALPDDVAKSGFSYGLTINRSNAEKAKAAALATCQENTDKEQLRPLCKVIVVFDNACVAVAMDPKERTPGVGWAVAPDKKVAEADAMYQCRATAGDSRRDFCQIQRSTGCDGSAGAR